MRKIGLLIVVVSALILSCCDSGEPMPAGSRAVELTMLATGANGFGIPSAGRIATGGWPSVNDSVAFSIAMLGVSKVELESIDSADDDDGCGDGEHGDDDDDDGDDDGDSTDNSGPGRIMHGGYDDDDHGDGDELTIEGAFTVDLIAGTSTPDMGFDSLGTGMFREIEITVAPILADSNSVFLAFEVFHDSTSQKVEFSTSRMFEVEIEKRHGLVIEDNPLGQILVLLHLERLLSHIDFTHLEADEDGVIRINDTSNMMLFALVKSRFNSSFEMGRDHDDDGDIDD